MSEHDGGKGDTPRPLGVSIAQFDANFEAIFGKKEKNTEPVPFAGYIEIDNNVGENDES